jgi:hypothetical protein
MLNKSGDNVTTLFTAVTTICNKLECVPGKPFKPNLIFAGKARAYPSETPFRCSTLGQAPQTLDFAGRAWQRQTILLITKSRNLRP